jgi:hypothetical protein
MSGELNARAGLEFVSKWLRNVLEPKNLHFSSVYPWQT